MSEKNVVNDFIKTIKDSRESTKVLCNSTQDVYVEAITFGQQKEVLASTLAGMSSITKIMLAIDNIIKQNCTVELSILDRIPAIVAMKALEKGSDYSILDKATLQQLKDNFAKFDQKESIVIEGQDFEIHMRIPTISTDIKYLKHASRAYDSVPEDEFGKITDIILSYEFPKFVEKFVFKDTDIVLDDTPITSVMKIFENLNSSVVGQMQDFIEIVRKYEEQLLTVNGEFISLEELFFDPKEDS